MTAWSRTFAILLLFVAYAPLAAQSDMTATGSWSGFIINSNCTSDEAYAEAEKCTANVPGGTFTFFDDTTRQVYKLDPQTGARGRLGESVTVKGVLEGDVIRRASITPLTSIGLPVGRKAPPISGRDQFGRQQTLETLKGPKGTVILFFRSADW